MQETSRPLDFQEKTMERLFAQYGDSILRTCFVYLKERSMAEDAMQDTFVKAFKNLQQLRQVNSEKAWLLRIAINTCKDYLRGSWLRFVDRRVSLDNLPEPSCPFQEQDMSLVMEVMKLPQHLRVVVLLYYYQDLKVPEVASLLGISGSAVYGRLKSAQNRLRTRLEGGHLDA